MKYLLMFFIFAAGFVGHVVVDEYANLRMVKEYNGCLNKTEHTPELSRAQQCKHLLEFTKVEAALLWTPQYWAKCLHDLSCQ